MIEFLIWYFAVGFLSVALIYIFDWLIDSRFGSIDHIKVWANIFVWPVTLVAVIYFWLFDD